MKKDLAAISIAGRKVGPGHPPFIVAEMSGNHNHSLDRALAIVDAVADAGADALKLQTYTADTITLDIRKGDFWVKDPKSLWKGQALYDLYKKAYTPWEWHKPLFKRAEKRGLIAFSTPFDFTAINFLKRLHVPAFKIASFENVDLELIRRAAAAGKPLIISTGLASLLEIQDAVQAARAAGCKDLILLKCTSAYPASPKESNLLTIPHLRETFNCQVGLSDHTIGIGASVASIAYGATLLERHVTLSRAEGGVDAAFSLEPQELALLVEESRKAWQALGTISYGPTAHEVASLVFRRSLYISNDMRAGERLTSKNLRSIRPGYGLPPKYLNILLGKRVKRALRKGTPMKWEWLA